MSLTVYYALHNKPEEETLALYSAPIMGQTGSANRYFEILILRTIS